MRNMGDYHGRGSGVFSLAEQRCEIVVCFPQGEKTLAAGATTTSAICGPRKNLVICRSEVSRHDAELSREFCKFLTGRIHCFARL